MRPIRTLLAALLGAAVLGPAARIAAAEPTFYIGRTLSELLKLYAQDKCVETGHSVFVETTIAGVRCGIKYNLLRDVAFMADCSIEDQGASDVHDALMRWSAVYRAVVGTRKVVETKMKIDDVPVLGNLGYAESNVIEISGKWDAQHDFDAIFGGPPLKQGQGFTMRILVAPLPSPP